MPKLLPDQSFYPSPTMAMQAPVETLAYVALLNPDPTASDALAVLDVDPASAGYGQPRPGVDPASIDGVTPVACGIRKPQLCNNVRGILANPDSPRAACHDEEVFLWGSIGMVICEEELPGNTLTATNLFIKEDGAWRMVHHHAGPVFMRQETVPRKTPKARLN